MIAFYEPPNPDAPNPFEATLTGAHQQRVNQVFTEAILKQTGGVLPSDEELESMVQTVIEEDGTYHLLWGAPDHAIGDDISWDYVIASVPPPTVEPNNENQ